MSLRSAFASESSTLLACSTSSSPSGYLRWINSVRPPSSFRATATFAGSREMRKTSPFCPIRTPTLCSISLSFSFRPPASVLAPSLSSSSSRAEGSANSTSRPCGASNDLIKRRQQNKPLSSTSIVIGLFPRVAQVVLAHELALEQRTERRRILAVLRPVHLERALQPRHLVPRDQAHDHSAPRRALRPRGAEARRDRADQQQRGAETRQGDRQAYERSRPGHGQAPALADPLGQHLDGSGRNGPQVLPFDQLVQGLEGLEFAEARDVEDLLHVLAERGELVDELVTAGRLAVFAVPVVQAVVDGLQPCGVQLLQGLEGRVGPGNVALHGRPFVHPPEP